MSLRVVSLLRRYFISGLAILFPVAVTVSLLVVIFRFSDGLLGRYINRFFISHYGYFIPGLGLLLSVVIILLAGFFASLVGKKIVTGIEAWFLKLPFVRQIYPPAKQMAEFLFSEKKKLAFAKPVLVEFPKEGSLAIGFVTNETITAAINGEDKRLISVLVPTTPTPLSGFMVMVEKEKLIFLDIAIDEALKMVISGGVISPSRLMLKKD